MSSGWTDEKIEQLKKLWTEGYTTGEIGKKLNVSKNAVVGKAHRLGLESRPSPIRRVMEAEEGESVAEDIVVPAKSEVSGNKTRAKVSAGSTGAKTAKEPPQVKKSIAKQPKKKFVKIEDLSMNSCRWPIGDPKEDDFHFCGKETFNGKPYCLEHCATAYVGINKKGQ